MQYDFEKSLKPFGMSQSVIVKFAIEIDCIVAIWLYMPPPLKLESISIRGLLFNDML
jgi:hypothetical protein